MQSKEVSKRFLLTEPMPNRICNGLLKYKEQSTCVQQKDVVANPRLSLEYATGTMVIIKNSVLIDLHEKARTYAAVKPVWHNYIIIILKKNLNFVKCRMQAKKYANTHEEKEYRTQCVLQAEHFAMKLLLFCYAEQYTEAKWKFEVFFIDSFLVFSRTENNKCTVCTLLWYAHYSVISIDHPLAIA